MDAKTATPETTVLPNSQQWKGMDGAIAFQLIERHAGNWADIGLMMGEWLAANAAAPLAAPEGWQPIETAPKDGTEILAWREDCDCLLVRWIAPIDFMTERELEESSSDNNEWQEQEDWFYADFAHGGRLEGQEVPTHWMPLPSAPGAAAVPPVQEPVADVLNGEIVMRVDADRLPHRTKLYTTPTAAESAAVMELADALEAILKSRDGWSAKTRATPLPHQPLRKTCER